MKRFIRMHENDDVATALEAALPGDTARLYGPDNVPCGELPVLEAVPFGHKIALRDLPAGHVVRKYNAPMGECVLPIAEGHWVHIHNVRSRSVDIPAVFKQEILRQMGIEGKMS